MRLGFAIAGAVIVLSMAGATVGIGMVQVQHIATVVRHYGHVEPFARGTIRHPRPASPRRCCWSAPIGATAMRAATRGRTR